MKFLVLLCVIFNVIIWTEAGVIDQFINTLGDSVRTIPSQLGALFQPRHNQDGGYSQNHRRRPPDRYHHHGGGYHDESCEDESGSGEHRRPYPVHPYNNQPGQWHDYQHPNNMHVNQGGYGYNPHPPPQTPDNFGEPSYQRPPYQGQMQRPYPRPRPDYNPDAFNQNSGNNHYGSSGYNPNDKPIDNTVPFQQHGSEPFNPYPNLNVNKPGYPNLNVNKPGYPNINSPAIPGLTTYPRDESEENTGQNYGNPQEVLHNNNNFPGTLESDQNNNNPTSNVQPGNQNENIPGSEGTFENNGLIFVPGNRELDSNEMNPFSKPNNVNNTPVLPADRVNTPTIPTTTTEQEFQLDIRFGNSTDDNTNSTLVADKNSSEPTGLDDRHLFETEGCPDGKRPNNNGRCVNKF